jgi:antitoxin (DNA-binding transcriptional repressor) of toxin-antitoxin stability system
MIAMSEHVIHISDAEAVSDFAAVLERVRAGAEVVIESGKVPVAILRPAEKHTRALSESLRLAEEHAKEMGCEPQLDSDFAADLLEIIKGRRPRALSSWE